MTDGKVDLVRDFFNQIESQIQFGDNKASLLIAGDALLLAISGGFVKLLASPGDAATGTEFLNSSIMLPLATTTAVLLIISLTCALVAARPAKTHRSPGRRFFHLSSLARISRDDFIAWYHSSSAEDLLTEALTTIHAKAEYAAGKFRWLNYAVHATILSLIVLLIALLSGVVTKVL
jgi:hypothetical protein